MDASVGKAGPYPGPPWRPATADIPKAPGVYRFRDEQGRVIYVGKAKNLRARLTNYFQDPAVLHPRTAQMVGQACSVQWTVVGSESEALTLEFQWIKQFDPRFNVMYRDDKSYPYLSVSMGEEFPRVAISRDGRKPGTRYFGPYTKVWAIRETIDLLLPVFPVRSCSAGVFRRAEAQGRPCLLGYIDRCSAPCIGRISAADHRELAEDLCRFMDGDTVRFTDQLEAQMREASANFEFEVAAKRRDELDALSKVQEKNILVMDPDVNADLFAMAADDLNASVQAFFVRGGRIRGTRGWVIDRVDDRSESELMHDLLEQVYVDRAGLGQARRSVAPTSVDDVAHLPVDAIPGQILVSVEPSEGGSLREVVRELAGRKVHIRVPKRGQKAQLMETVFTNAKDALRLHKTSRAGDLTQRALALEGLQEALGLENAPLRIECFDISHTGGEHKVASMVVFEDGIPRKNAYRTFTIRGEEGAAEDDTAAMGEVLRRRFKRMGRERAAREREQDWETIGSGKWVEELEEDGSDEFELVSGEVSAESGKPRRFAYDPELVVVDGGLAQVNAARQALLDVGVNLPVVGLAKRLEEVWVPGSAYPVILPRTSPALYLLQHLRDESHRFAITKHRKKRQGAMTRSILDEVPGLGPARQRALLKYFGSVKRIREAGVTELTEVAGVGPSLATAISEHLNPQIPDDSKASQNSIPIEPV